MREYEFPSGHKITNERQLRVLDVLEEVGSWGITAREMAQAEWAGDVSGVNNWGGPMTVLRQHGIIVALSETRERHHVNVLPEFVEGRTIWPGYHHTGHCLTCTCWRSSPPSDGWQSLVE